jgi:hypothetical protein
VTDTNSSSKAFGISFADRPKAKTEKFASRCDFVASGNKLYACIGTEDQKCLDEAVLIRLDLDMYATNHTVVCV